MSARPVLDDFGKDRFAEHPLLLAGKQLVADRSGALVWPGERLLVVADLHLEKGSARVERGSYLPPYDTRTTLGRLAGVIARHDPDTVICLGDSLHDRKAGDRLLPDDLEVIAEMQAGREWLWITGNHDPVIPAGLGGTVAADVTISGLTFRHEPSIESVGAEIAAHLHPAAKLVRHGYATRRPCFFASGKRLVLPAFGAFTGGLNVLDEAFSGLISKDGFRVYMTGHEGVYPVATRDLRGD